MRISGGAVPAWEAEARMFGWLAASTTYQTDGPAEEEPFAGLSGARALEAGADRVLSTASPVEEIVATVQRFVGG